MRKTIKKSKILKKRIIITGTHHTPAIELIKQLKNDNRYRWDIYYIAHLNNRESHITHTIIPKLNINFFPLESGKYDRRFLGKTIKGIPSTVAALIKSFFLVKKIKPDIVVSFGGYISVPVIISAGLNHIPAITHEQTLTNSLSTKINSFFVKKVALSFDYDLQKRQFPSQKTVITGNLIRSEIFNNKTSIFSNLNPILIHKPLIYITGGNQGSQAINGLVAPILPKLLEKYTIIHQTGKINYDSMVRQTKKYFSNPNYVLTEYIGLEDIGWVLNNAVIIIGRSGANTCQEINILNKKSILIPHPYTQQNEQLLNAFWLQQQQPDKTIIIRQPEASPEKILSAVELLMSKKDLPHQTKFVSGHIFLNLIHEIV